MKKEILYMRDTKPSSQLDKARTRATDGPPVKKGIPPWLTKKQEMPEPVTAAPTRDNVYSHQTDKELIKTEQKRERGRHEGNIGHYNVSSEDEGQRRKELDQLLTQVDTNQLRKLADYSDRKGQNVDTDQLRRLATYIERRSEIPSLSTEAAKLGKDIDNLRLQAELLRASLETINEP